MQLGSSKTKKIFPHTKALCLEVKCSEMELFKGKHLQNSENKSTIHHPPGVTQKYQSQLDREMR